MSETAIDSQVLREAQLVMLRILKQVDIICRENQIPYWLDAGTLLGAVRHQGFIPWDDDVDICMLRSDYEKFLKIAPPLLPAELFLQNFYTDPYCIHNFSKIRDENSRFVDANEQNGQICYHQGIYIDIFPVDKLSTQRWVRYFWRNVVIKKVYTLCSIIVRYCQRPLKRPWHRNLLKNFRTIIIKKLFGKFKFPNLCTAAAIERLLRRFATIQSQQPEGFVLGYGLGLPLKSVHTYETVFPLKELLFEDATFFVPNNWDQYLRDIYGDTYMQLPKEEARRTPHAIQIIPSLNK
ncbi:MAG TPA: LicD family protein [Bacillota bacterium]